MKFLALLCVGNLATINPALSVEWSAFTLLATAVGVMAWFVVDALGGVGMDAEANRAMCEIFLLSIVFGAVPAWIGTWVFLKWRGER